MRSGSRSARGHGWGPGNAERTPLWPAGHLPLKGGDQMSEWVSPTVNVSERGSRLTHVISPLEREMADRPEGARF
ncbi:hypothetical protein DUP91_27400, partial [Salmonella enterica subsp. enterica]|nr:hypothetical protein [Salmonella enterica subsp. enterica]